MLNKKIINAKTLPDLWFQAIYNILEDGRTFKIDRGSYAGQTRLEYDYFMGHVEYPGTTPLLPEIPLGIDIPAPVEYDYIFGGDNYERSYMEYLMTNTLQPGESYTYGERLTAAFVNSKKQHEIMMDSKCEIYNELNFIMDNRLNQIEWIIDTYKRHGHRNNQMVIQVADPTDLLLVDPPCLRSIDTRIQDNKLHFFVYFRSWDLWGGLPANLAGIQTLKEYMAAEIGVDDGEMIVESKGLHLYGYAEDLAKLRCLKNNE